MQILPEITEISLKGSARASYPVHTMLLNFSKEYNTLLLQNRHSLVVFFSVETEKSGGVKVEDIDGLQKSVCGYSMK